MTSVAERSVGSGGSLDAPDPIKHDRMCRELFWEVEQRLIMHKLSKDYYGFRAFWLQCMPLLLMTTCIAIVAFIEYGYTSTTAGAGVEARRRWPILSVGILGLLSAALTSTMINTRYQSQRDLHAMAERTLAKVCQSVRFPERAPPGNGTGGGAATLVEFLHRQKAIAASVECMESNVPAGIERSFADLRHAMATKSYTFRAIQYERFYYVLWKMLAGRSRGGFVPWPLAVPEIDVSRSELGRVIDEEYAKFGRGQEMVARRKSSLDRNNNNNGDDGSDRNDFNNSHSTMRTSRSPSINSGRRYNDDSLFFNNSNSTRMTTSRSPSINSGRRYNDDSLFFNNSNGTMRMSERTLRRSCSISPPRYDVIDEEGNGNSNHGSDNTRRKSRIDDAGDDDDDEESNNTRRKSRNDDVGDDDDDDEEQALMMSSVEGLDASTASAATEAASFSLFESIFYGGPPPGEQTPTAPALPMLNNFMNAFQDA